MKKLILIFTLSWAMFFGKSMAQSFTPHDPAVQQARAQLFDEQGNGQLSFEYTQHISDYTMEGDMDPVRVAISLLHFQPKDGIYSIGGDLASKFSWMYDEATNCFMGYQEASISAEQVGQITIDVLASQMIACSEGEKMGFSVNIQPAPCMNGINDISNDFCANYTCAQQVSTAVNTLEDLINYSLYPNPVSDYIIIELEQQVPTLKVDLIDIQGKIVYTFLFENTTKQRINTKQLPAGLYNLNIHADGQIVREKIIVAQ